MPLFVHGKGRNSKLFLLNCVKISKRLCSEESTKMGLNYCSIKTKVSLPEDMSLEVTTEHLAEFITKISCNRISIIHK